MTRILLTLLLVLASTGARAQCDPSTATAGSVGCQATITGTVQSTDYFLGWRPTAPKGLSVKIPPARLLEAGLPAAFSTLAVTGASTLSSLSATNGTFSGTLGVTGATTLSSLSATTGLFSSTLGVTGTATFSGALNVPSGNVTVGLSSLAGTAGINLRAAAGNLRQIQFQTGLTTIARWALNSSDDVTLTMWDAAGANGKTMIEVEYKTGDIADPHEVNLGPALSASEYIDLDVAGDVKGRTFTASPSALGPLSGATSPPNTATFKTNYSGSSRSSQINTVSVGSNDDSLASYTTESLDYLEVTGSLATGWNGSRVGIRSSILTNVATTLSNDSRAFTSFSGSVQMHANMGGVAAGYGTRHFGYGTGFGIFFKTVANTGATYLQGNVGGEINVTTETGASVLNQVGLQLVHEATNAVAPQRQNVGFMVADQGGASVNAGWEVLFSANDYGAQWPGNPNSTVLGARSGNNYGSVPSNVAIGVDMLEINTTGTGRTGGDSAYRWQGGRIIPAATGGSVQVGPASLTGTASGATLDLNYSQMATIAINTAGTGYSEGDLFGIPTAGAIGRVTSVFTKTITGATAANPIVVTSVGHGLANGTEVELSGFVGITQLNSLTITGITNANPGVVTIANHGLPNGAAVRVAGVLGMSQINGVPYFLVANRTANTFTLTHLNGSAVDTSAFGTYTSGGTVILPYLTANATADTFTLTDLAGSVIDGSGYTAYVSGGTARTYIPSAVSIHRAGWQVSGPTTNVATSNLTRGLTYGSGLTVDLTWTPQTTLLVQPSGGATSFALTGARRAIGASAAPTIAVYNQMTDTTGSLTNGVLVDTDAYGTGPFENWGVVSRMSLNGANTIGAIVPGYFRGSSFASGAASYGSRAVWGIVAEARDDSGNPSGTSNTILQGVEVNVEADGDDDIAGYGRLGVVIISSRGGSSGTMTGSYGLALQSGANSQWKRGIQVDGQFTVSGIDTTDATFVGSAPAIRLAAGNVIALDAAAATSIVSDATTITLTGDILPVSLPVSCAGKAAGTLWNDTLTVKVCP